MVPVVTVGAFVVALAAVDWSEILCDGSYAATVYKYVVDALNPVSPNEVLLMFAINVPFLNTSYPATLLSGSVDAFHERFICDDETAVAVNPVGAVGDVLSTNGVDVGVGVGVGVDKIGVAVGTGVGLAVGVTDGLGDGVGVGVTTGVAEG